jgi:hypothetical protein
MRKFRSTTYTKANFEQIATAIGTTLKPVADLDAQFEAAALWFRLDKGRPKRPTPSKQHEKLTQVAKSASRLLKSLGIDDPHNAADGPGDHEIFRALVLAGEPDENAVLETTRRIGRLVEILEGIAATGELDWIAAMLGIYRTLTGKEPATSVGAPTRANEGKAIQVPSFGFFRPLANH